MRVPAHVLYLYRAYHESYPFHHYFHAGLNLFMNPDVETNPVNKIAQALQNDSN